MSLFLRSTLLLAFLVSANLLAAPAAAQHPRVEKLAPGVQWEPISPVEGYLKAKKETKLLLVYYYTPGSASAAHWDRQLWKNPTLGLYLQWHAVSVKYAWPRMSGFMILKDEDMMVTMGKVPCFRDGCRLEPDAYEPRLRRAGMPGLAAPRLAGAASLLFRLDVTMDRLVTLDPVWLALHNERNPPPEPPPMPPPFHLSDDGLGERIEDPAPERTVDALWDMLESARRAADTGNLHGATGLYTWIWECADEIDPAFAPARRAFIAGEITDLGWKRPAARERFASIRDARARRLLWADYDDYHEWCVLNAMAGEDDLIVEWFDYFINDEQEATMIPRADREAYMILLDRERFGDPWELGESPVGRVSRIASLRRARRPPTIDHDDWERLQAFLRQHLLHEACRLHAACLRAGRADDADRIATSLLREQDTPEARHALVTTALVAGVPQPDHLRLLDEAELRGNPRPDLRQRLQSALRTTQDPATTDKPPS